ncbi:hypothetical protein NG799_19025 [Laspinema sp. D1]|uniref:Uncharacterized protein n=1 Tax=Laspinema palackyanum D2a TaxID=2953684 RepID=A0ABT2MUI1_9CYAN|nr:hypothetical protein [Laspinema sp. D2a]
MADTGKSKGTSWVAIASTSAQTCCIPDRQHRVQFYGAAILLPILWLLFESGEPRKS